MPKNKRPCLVSALLCCLSFFWGLACTTERGRPYLKAALEAALWIEASAVQTADGQFWPSVPGEELPVNNWLYSGNSGIVIFLLEAYHSCGEKKYLEQASAGADFLLASLDAEKGAGFYTGISGIGFALQETYKATGDVQYLEGFKKCLRFLADAAVEEGKGVQWSTTTDIIGGSAGTGLFLLYAFQETGDAFLLELASRAGTRLIEVGQQVKGGTKWAMDPNFPRLMPNFAHGTAGIAYYLATLYTKTQNEAFLNAALAGARYLQNIAKTEGDTCLIFHHEPEGEDLFYLGWCHGPVGTARLFFRLYEITRDAEWVGWVEGGAQAILKSGIPESNHDGFWNNVGICCGSAGVADFFLSLYKITQKKEYFDFADFLTEDLLTAAEREEGGLKWIQAEHRVRPDFLQAQTGLMQGAAGIGLWLLRLDAFEQERSPEIIFPDNPFL
jgi:lantibiotic modifying enzyme